MNAMRLRCCLRSSNAHRLLPLDAAAAKETPDDRADRDLEHDVRGRQWWMVARAGRALGAGALLGAGGAV